MNPNQPDSDIFRQNAKFIVLGFIFLVLSLIGIFLFWKIRNNEIIVPKIDLEPSPIPTVFLPTPIPTVLPTPTDIILISPTATPTSAIILTTEVTVRPSPTIKPTSIPKPTKIPVPTNILLTTRYQNDTDKFVVNYASYRKVYEEKEGNGNLYTFYSPKGSFAVHVSYSDWVWINSERSFSNSFTINNLPTFRYDTNSQTLIDVENTGKKYTIQCVHNNNSFLKSECEDFIKSFQIL